jgi:hypothetical protein
MAISDVDARIAAALARRAGVSLVPDKIETGSEGQTRRSHASAGQIDVTVPSSMSAAGELALMTAPTMYGPKSTSITMRDSSMEPTADNSLLINDSLLVWLADTGAGYVEGAQTIFVQPQDGDVVTDPKAALKVIYAELLKGKKITFAKGGK